MSKIIHTKTKDIYIILGHISDKTNDEESIIYMKSNGFISDKIVVLLIKIIKKLTPYLYSRDIIDFNNKFNYHES